MDLVRDRAAAEDVTQERSSSVRFLHHIEATLILQLDHADRAQLRHGLLRRQKSQSRAIRTSTWRRKRGRSRRPRRAGRRPARDHARAPRAIPLIEVFGLSYAEQSDVLGIRVGTVKRSHASRATALCRALADDADTEEIR